MVLLLSRTPLLAVSAWRHQPWWTAGPQCPRAVLALSRPTALLIPGGPSPTQPTAQPLASLPSCLVCLSVWCIPGHLSLQGVPVQGNLFAAGLRNPEKDFWHTALHTLDQPLRYQTTAQPRAQLPGCLLRSPVCPPAHSHLRTAGPLLPVRHLLSKPSGRRSGTKTTPRSSVRGCESSSRQDTRHRGIRQAHRSQLLGSRSRSQGRNPGNQGVTPDCRMCSSQRACRHMSDTSRMCRSRRCRACRTGRVPCRVPMAPPPLQQCTSRRLRSVPRTWRACCRSCVQSGRRRRRWMQCGTCWHTRHGRSSAWCTIRSSVTCCTLLQHH
mmetsp:Transcript_5810/g.16600  ORF Transcript_5810/g.16600 Transcript_5810/m.16600 type:complete len:325 (-) Transcript_5810:998-1972(-)